jgi:hypothetical protein
MARLLGTLAALAVLLSALPVGAGGSAVSLGQLRLPGYAAPSRLLALDALAAEVAQRTSIVTAPRSRTVMPADTTRFDHPLLLLPCPAPLPQLGMEEGTALATWLRLGGTLFLDWQGGAADLESFRSSLDSFVATVVPGGTLERVSRASVLYRSFYRLPYASGRVRLVDDIYGVLVEGRVAILVSFNDMLSAAERTAEGEYRFEVVPGGDTQREDAVRFLVNVVAYALCLDYKDDKVHLDYLKSKRNWQLPGEE